jgi:membrane protease YdiL (CAAX protease family)
VPFTLAILVVILSYTWFLEPRTPRWVVNVPGALVVGLGLWHAARRGEWGMSRGAFLPALRAVALFTVAAGGALLAAGAAAGTLHDRRDFLGSLVVLIVWGGAQQWILQTVVLREAQAATSRVAGVALAALLFGIVHLPNPFLTAITTAGAIGWCAIYDRHPHVVPLALSHALGTLAVLYAFDDAATGRLRIGLSYLRLDR